MTFLYANDLRPLRRAQPEKSSSIPANTPPVFSGLRSHLAAPLRLVRTEFEQAPRHRPVLIAFGFFLQVFGLSSMLWNWCTLLPAMNCPLSVRRDRSVLEFLLNLFGHLYFSRYTDEGVSCHVLDVELIREVPTL